VRAARAAPGRGRALRESTASRSLGHFAHFDAYRGEARDRLDQHVVGLVGRGLDRQGSEDTVARTQKRPTGIDDGVGEFAVAQVAQAVGVGDERNSRGDRLLVGAV
jgi:hypothetical protein